MSKNWQGYNRLLSAAEIDELEQYLNGVSTIFIRDHDLDSYSSANAYEDELISAIDKHYGYE